MVAIVNGEANARKAAAAPVMLGALRDALVDPQQAPAGMAGEGNSRCHRQGRGRGMSAEAVANLIDIYCHAHAVLCREKAAIEKGWQTRRPTPGEVWNHLNANPHNRVGVVPSSLGFTVMDVDIGSPARIALAGPAGRRHSQPRGGQGASLVPRH